MHRLTDLSAKVVAALGVCVLVGALGTGQAHADSVSWGFEQLEPTPPDFSANFAMTATYDPGTYGADWVHFLIEHTGDFSSDGRIVGVYFDDEALGLFDFGTTPGLSGTGSVAFQGSSSPPLPEDLPGQEDFTPPFTTTFGFTATSPNNGITVNNSLAILLKLTAGQDWDDVKNALPIALRVGLFVQDADGNDSFKYATTENPPDSSEVIPLPAAAWSGLAMLGTLGVVAAYRRRQRLAGV
ncbi:MAG: hypothetical protein WD009_12780 [Phycisphaeraceae bacterium]